MSNPEEYDVILELGTDPEVRWIYIRRNSQGKHIIRRGKRCVKKIADNDFKEKYRRVD